MLQVPSGAGKKLTDQDLIGKSQDEIDMMRVMGFGNFDTTKNKKVRRSANSQDNCFVS